MADAIVYDSSRNELKPVNTNGPSVFLYVPELQNMLKIVNVTKKKGLAGKGNQTLVDGCL